MLQTKGSQMISYTDEIYCKIHYACTKDTLKFHTLICQNIMIVLLNSDTAVNQNKESRRDIHQSRN